MITVVNEDPSNSSFWGALGGQIEVTNGGEDDKAAERKAAEEVSERSERVEDEDENTSHY